MAGRPDPLDIAKSARALEWLRAELVGSAARVMRGMLHADEGAILEGLTGAIIVSYLLARRLGIPFARLENELLARLRASADDGHEVEEWYGDLTALRSYLERARGVAG